MDKVLMPGAVRNKPCPCGSGLKTKRCGCDGAKLSTQIIFANEKVSKRLPGSEVERFTRGAGGVYAGAFRSSKVFTVKARGGGAMRAELARVGLRKRPTIPTGICTSRGPRQSKGGVLVDGCGAGHNEGRRDELPCIADECGKPTLGRQVVLCWDAPACPEHNMHRDYRVEVKLYLTGRIGMVARRRVEIVKAP